MEHEAYDGLSFSYAVVAREPKAHGCREVLIDARRTDAQEMVCFLRTLDLDCDGKSQSVSQSVSRRVRGNAASDATAVHASPCRHTHTHVSVRMHMRTIRMLIDRRCTVSAAGTISEADFCHATNPRVTKFNIDLLGRIDESWQAAAMAEERQLRSARGMNRTGQN